MYGRVEALVEIIYNFTVVIFEITRDFTSPDYLWQ